MRDVVQFLLDDSLAFKALPSHDAQSIAGILSTDEHGTSGRDWDWGFVSQSVVSLKLVDGREWFTNVSHPMIFSKRLSEV